MTFKVVTNSTIETNFTFAFVQVFTNLHFGADYADGATWEITSPSYSQSILDTSYLYNDYTNQTTVVDSPGWPLVDYNDHGTISQLTNVVYGFNAKMFLFYKSTAPVDDAIWVPVAVIPWSFSMVVRKTNSSILSWSKYSIAVPTVPQPSSKTYSYPYWTNNFKTVDYEFKAAN